MILEGFKTLTPKQMLVQELLVMRDAQVKTGNNSEDLLTKNRQIVYLLY